MEKLYDSYAKDKNAFASIDLTEDQMEQLVSVLEKAEKDKQMETEAAAISSAIGHLLAAKFGIPVSDKNVKLSRDLLNAIRLHRKVSFESVANQKARDFAKGGVEIRFGRK